MPDKIHTKYLLSEDQMPRAWYNIVSDMPNPPVPPLHPGTQKPVTPDDLAPLFPMALIQQEVSTERYIEIPDPVRQIYAQWRPSPLYRARRLEKALDTPARIYYKYEGVSPVGSHKPNTSVPQAFYNKEEGIKKLSTRRGQASGDQLWRWRARSLTWTSRSLWSRLAISRNHIDEVLCKPMERLYTPVQRI